MDTVPEFHAEAPQAIIASEGLAQRPYVMARAGFKPALLLYINNMTKLYKLWVGSLKFRQG